MTRTELEHWGRWVADLCLRFGSSVSTAYKVAATFVEGLEKEVGVVETNG